MKYHHGNSVCISSQVGCRMGCRFCASTLLGLTRNLTSSLNLCGKMIIIATMYLGRVGPISLLIAFNTKKEKKNIIKNPTEDISVG